MGDGHASGSLGRVSEPSSGTLVRTLAPQRLPARAVSVLAGDRQGSLRVLNVALDAHDRDSRVENLLNPSIEVRAASLRPITLPLRQVEPGRYESRIVTDVTTPLTFSLVDEPQVVGGTRIFAVDHAAEYRFGEPDERVLAEISRATGGIMNPTADDVERVARVSAVARHPLAPWLLLVGLVAWLADIGVRRLAR